MFTFTRPYNVIAPFTAWRSSKQPITSRLNGLVLKFYVKRNEKRQIWTFICASRPITKDDVIKLLHYSIV